MKKIEYFIKKYLENRPAFYAFIRPQEAILFQQYQKYIKSPVLDFGCGDGFFAQIVFGKGIINVGLDLKNSRAHEAEKAKIYKKVVYYDGLTIPYPNNYFQTIISNCVLEHIPSLDNSLKEIYRVLKPGGYFLTTVMTDQWEKNLIGRKLLGKFYLNFMRKTQQHQHLLTDKQWSQKFNKAGFKIIKSVGYLSPTASRYNEIFHYLSFPSLITYKLFKRWNLFPRLGIIGREFIINNISSECLNLFSANFYLLRKK